MPLGEGDAHDADRRSPREVPALNPGADLRPEVLIRAANLDFQLACRMQREVRVAQQLAREEHDVRLATAHDLIGLARFGDQPHGADAHSRLAPNALGEWRLVRGTDGD